MAIVEFYIKNFMGQDGNIVTNETLFQTIPFSAEGPVITNPKVKTELGKAGSFEFGLEMLSPYYDAMLQMKTIIRIVYFGKTLFRGRVLTIDRNLGRTRTIHCEGDFAFLLDSHQMGTKEETRPKTTVGPYLSSLISQHNSDVGDPDKEFRLGEVPGQYSSNVRSDQRVDIPADKANQQFGSSSHDSTMDRFESLLGDFGGYWRTRYDDSTGRTYLDWFDNYYTRYTNKRIQVASNLIDLSGSTEVENLFTVVVPVGKSNSKDIFVNDWWPRVSKSHAKVNYITVPDLATVPLYSDSELNSGYHRKEDYANAIDRFGKIWKTVDFENADTPEKLFSYCKDWIKNNYVPELTQWSVSALDLKFVNGEEEPLFTGDQVMLVHPEVDQDTPLTVISAEYDLYNPDKDNFKIGIPNQQVNSSYGVKKKQTKGTNAVASPTNPITATKPDTSSQTVQAQVNHDHDILQQQYIRKTNWGEDIELDEPLAFLKYETDGVTEKDPAVVAKETAETVMRLEWTRQSDELELMSACLDQGFIYGTGDPRELQVVIDHTPEIKEKQRWWKAQTAVNMIKDGLTQQEVDLLLNDSESQSWLASLVDENGNWTEEALQRGVLMWNNAEKIRQTCIRAKKLHRGEGVSTAAKIVNGAQNWLTGGNMNLGGYMSFLGLDNKGGLLQSFSLGDLLSTFDTSGGTSESFQQVMNFFGDLGSLFNGSSKDEDGKSVIQRGWDFFMGLFKGSDLSKTGPDGKPIAQQAIELISGLFNLNEETSTDGENKEKIERTFDLLDGLFTGAESGAKDALEKLKTFFLGNDHAEIDGENGTASFGLKIKTDADGNPVKGWYVKLNDTVTYKDKNGKEHTVSGFVTADDFKIDEIPSFKTKLAVIDTLFVEQADINKLYANRLEAVEAYIDKINANTVTANVFVSTDYLWVNTVVASKKGSFKTLYVDDGTDDWGDVSRAYNNALLSFKDGEFKLVLTRLNNKQDDKTELTFNVADSAWFQEQMSAAEGNADAVIKDNSITHIAGDISYALKKLTVYVSATPQLVTKKIVTNEDGEEEEQLVYTDKTPLEDGIYIPLEVSTIALSLGEFKNSKFTITKSTKDEIAVDGKNGITIDVPVTGLDLPISKQWYWGTPDQQSVPSVPGKNAYCSINADGASIITTQITGSVDTPEFSWDKKNKRYTYSLSGTVLADNTKMLALTGTATPVDATKAVNYGKSLVTLAAPSWTEWSQPILPSSRTVTVKTLGRTDEDGKAATLEADISLHLTQTDEWPSNNKKIVYLRTESDTNVMQTTVDASQLVVDAIDHGKTLVKIDSVSAEQSGKYVEPTKDYPYGYYTLLAIATADNGESGEGGGTLYPVDAYNAGVKAGAGSVDTDIDVIGPFWSKENDKVDGSNTAEFKPRTGGGDSVSVSLEMTNALAINWNPDSKLYAIGATGIVKEGSNERLKLISSDSLPATEAINYGKSLVALDTIKWNSTGTNKGKYTIATKGRMNTSGNAQEYYDYLDPVDVTISGPTWTKTASTDIDSSNTATFETNGATKQTATLRLLFKTQSTPTDGKIPVELHTDTVNGPLVAKVEINVPESTGAPGKITNIDQQKTAEYNEARREYTVYAEASGTNLDPYSKTLTVDASKAIKHGEGLVHVTGASLVENLMVYDPLAEEARGALLVTLSNGTSKTLTDIVFDQAYHDGLRGLQEVSEQEFEFVLEDDEDFFNTDDYAVDVSTIYEKGVADKPPSNTIRYVYRSNGKTVEGYSNYVYRVYLSQYRIGYLYPRTPVYYLRDISKSYTDVSMCAVMYEGKLFYMEKSYLRSSPDSPTNYPGRIGWASGTYYPSYEYTGYVVSNDEPEIMIYNSQSLDNPSGITIPNGATVKCQNDPNGYSYAWIAIKYGDYTGYVQSKYIQGSTSYNDEHPETPVITKVQIDSLKHSVDSFSEDMSSAVTLKPKYGTETAYTSKAVSDGTYKSIAVTSGKTLTTYLHRKTTRFGIEYYGYHDFHTASVDVTHKAEITADYSNNTTETVVLEFKTYPVPQEMYIYNSGKEAVTLWATAGGTVSRGKIVPQTPVTVYYIYDNEWAYIEYDGRAGYVKYTSSTSTTQLSYGPNSPTKYDYTGWLKDSTDPDTPHVSDVEITRVIHGKDYGDKLNVFISLKYENKSFGGKFYNSAYTVGYASTNTNASAETYIDIGSKTPYHDGEKYASKLLNKAQINVYMSDDPDKPAATYWVEFESKPIEPRT